MQFFRALTAVFFALTIASPASAQNCQSDLSGDGQVNGADLAILLSDWGLCPPTISSVSPLQGGTQGGTILSITGTGLSSTSSVTVGGAVCPNVTIISPTLIRATTPPGPVGDAQITVTTAAGTGNSPTPFGYVQQQVTSITPSSGIYSGGTPITISGQYLAGATSVTIGGVPCTSVVSVSSTQVTAVTPPGSIGAVDVVVTCPKGAVTAPSGFTYITVAVPAWATLLEALPDSAVVTDPNLRAAITASGLAWRVRHAVTGIEMLLVPPGNFEMGCTPCTEIGGCGASASNAVPLHSVTLSSAFYLGRYEVTQAQWSAQMGSNPSCFHEYPNSPQRPVGNLSWTNAAQFVTQAGLRLPTEAEWEFACRAGTQSCYYNSNTGDYVTQIAWISSNSGGQTRPVGSRLPNQLGFYDMIGNVTEWLNDWYQPDWYTYSPSLNPTGPASGNARVQRGGAFDTDLVWSFSRSGQLPQTAADCGYGLRVAKSP
jgi:formylglycine-generating enzyme required for sulfatase activity